MPGIGEIIGGSQREERYDVLLNRIRELGLNEEDYSWYLDLRKYGGTKHAGYGLGFERLIMYITGVQQHPRRTAIPQNHRFCGVLKKRGDTPLFFITPFSASAVGIACFLARGQVVRLGSCSHQEGAPPLHSG